MISFASRWVFACSLLFVAPVRAQEPAASDQRPWRCERIECVEINIVCDDERPRCVAIFWFHDAFGRWRIRDCRPAETVGPPQEGGENRWRFAWSDYGLALREVETDWLLYTVTFEDRETEEGRLNGWARPGLLEE